MGSRRSLPSNKEINGNATMPTDWQSPTKTVAVPEMSVRVPLRDITNIIEAVDRERRLRSSLPAGEPAAEQRQSATAEASAPQKPVASDQSRATEAALVGPSDARSTQPVTTSVPSPVNVVPSPEQPLQTATAASGSAHVAGRDAAAAPKRRPRKASPKALPSKKARQRRALLSMR